MLRAIVARVIVVWIMILLRLHCIAEIAHPSSMGNTIDILLFLLVRFRFLMTVQIARPAVILLACYAISSCYYSIGISHGGTSRPFGSCSLIHSRAMNGQ